ncbi:DNA polymerase III subunit delta [Bifidobacterium gallicum]|nr:hypothetical protein [Bifidobacterium gallicum]EFA23146.1 putative DNA polymerase III, delta subunit [Bifidobacterium gallicum DSM 20093 = LMG 11596]
MRANQSANCVIVQGGDAFLNRQQVLELVRQASEYHPERDVVELDATTATPMMFEEAISPSLLSDAANVTVWNVQNADEPFINAILEWLKQAGHEPDPSFVVVSKEAGPKGKAVIERLRKTGAQVLDVPDLKKTDAKLNYVLQRFERHQRRIEPMAAQQLVAVFGEDIGALNAMCEQLCFDFDEPVTLDLVERYLVANPQVTGFNVADLALAGRVQDAVIALRNAVAQGTEPILLVSALAIKLRSLAKAGAVKAGQITAAETKMAPWMLKNATKQLHGWTSPGLARCIRLLAWADEQCKTNGADPLYALERCVSSIAARGMH